MIIVTLGLVYFAINVAMLALAEWIAPDFSIDGFWTYVGATIVVWLVNVVVGGLLGHPANLLRRPRTVDEFSYSSSSTSNVPAVTWSPSATWRRRTVASYGETTGVSIFIASSTSNGWRAATASPLRRARG